MRKAFRLRSQGLPFKQIGAVPMEQPIVQNPNDPRVQQAQMQEQRTPMMEVDDKEEKATLGGTLKKIGLGAVDMLTAGLDRVYSTGKTNTLGGSKAITFAKTKAELAEQAKKDKEALDKASITDIVK